MATKTLQFYSQPQIFNTNYLSLSYSYSESIIQMELRVKSPFISTKSFPKTYEILERVVPSSLTSQCFNNLNLPFHVEVKATEMGHLLEHILLEYLCIEKMDSGSDEADFSGETSWDWIKDPHGTFTISIHCSISDYIFFFPALEKSIQVLEEILESKLTEYSQSSFFQPTYSQPTYPSVPTTLT